MIFLQIGTKNAFGPTPRAVSWRLDLDIAASFWPTFPVAFYAVYRVKIALCE